MKRFVIILLALLSGLSVPQAVAAAAGRADASVIAAPVAVRVAQPGNEAHASTILPRGEVAATRQALPLSGDDAPPVATVQRSDRARE